MPKRVVQELGVVERLEILGPDGSVDRDLEPKIPAKQLIDLYRGMLRGRRFDERMLQLQRQGRIGTFAPIKGQEAANIGTVCHLKDSDWMVPSFRETAAQLWRGAEMDKIWLFSAGFNEGSALPEGTRTLPLCVPVATQLLQAVGIAYAAKLRGEKTIVMTYCGDGGTSEGDFHEALNFAAVWNVPVVFIVQNNQWAISVPLSKQTASPTLAQKAVAYGMPHGQVDGNDILAVWSATRDAVKAVRAEQGPRLLECVTYRLGVHTTADDPTKYRSAEEVARWEKRDPIPRFEAYLRAKKVLDDKKQKQVEEDIKAELKAAWPKAEKAIEDALAGAPDALFDGLYAQEPPSLNRQRHAFLTEREKGWIDG